MLFRRKPQEAPEPQGAEQPADEHEAVLRDELGLCHLWFLELRLSQELARASRIGNVFSLATWQLRLLPTETPDPELLARAAAFIQGSLRPYDVVARVDTDRFVGLLGDAKYEDACTVAYRIKGDLEVRVPSAGRWQAGVATFGRDGVDGDALILASIRRLDDRMAA